MRRVVAEAEDVGRRFPEEVRKMALNETKHRLVKGEVLRKKRYRF